MSVMVSVLLAVSFMGIAVWRERKLPESISAMVYDLPEGGWRWLWSVWLWCVAVTLAPSLIESIPEPWKAVGFLCLAALMFTGAFPLFDREHKDWHNVLGVLAGILSQACVWFICPWWLLLWLLLPLVAWLGRKEAWLDGKGVFLAECVSMLAMYGSLLSERRIIMGEDLRNVYFWLFSCSFSV
jgi:hypothetical protein